MSPNGGLGDGHDRGGPSPKQVSDHGQLHLRSSPKQGLKLTADQVEMSLRERLAQGRCAHKGCAYTAVTDAICTINVPDLGEVEIKLCPRHLRLVTERIVADSQFHWEEP